jgi:hypothetical protein
VNEFLQRHGSRIVGVLSGFDRLVFRGTLRSISYVVALERFLSAHHILYKDFAVFVQNCTAQIERHAQAVARRAGRPYQCIAKPSLSKEDMARHLALKLDVKKGLVCVLYVVEPCQTFDIYATGQVNACASSAVSASAGSSRYTTWRDRHDYGVDLPPDRCRTAQTRGRLRKHLSEDDDPVRL